MPIKRGTRSRLPVLRRKLNIRLAEVVVLQKDKAGLLAITSRSAPNARKSKHVIRLVVCPDELPSREVGYAAIAIMVGLAGR